MPRVELRDGYNGVCWRLDTFDPAKIGPWLAEMLTGGHVYADYTCPAQLILWPLEPGELSTSPMQYTLDDDGRARLAEDFAGVLGLRATGGFVRRQPGD